MKIDDAEAYVHYHTHEDDGTYFRLRLGRHPGVEAVRALQCALRTIRFGYAGEQYLPRSIVVPCGIILHFAPECLQNLKASGAPQEMLDAVVELKQISFDILAGHEFNDQNAEAADLV